MIDYSKLKLDNQTSNCSEAFIACDLFLSFGSIFIQILVIFVKIPQNIHWQNNNLQHSTSLPADIYTSGKSWHLCTKSLNNELMQGCTLHFHVDVTLVDGEHRREANDGQGEAARSRALTRDRAF